MANVTRNSCKEWKQNFLSETNTQAVTDRVWAYVMLRLTERGSMIPCDCFFLLRNRKGLSPLTWQALGITRAHTYSVVWCVCVYIFDFICSSILVLLHLRSWQVTARGFHFHLHYVSVLHKSEASVWLAVYVFLFFCCHLFLICLLLFSLRMAAWDLSVTVEDLGPDAPPVTISVTSDLHIGGVILKIVEQIRKCPISLLY